MVSKVVIFFHFLISVLLIIFILLQKGDGAGLTSQRTGLEVEESKSSPAAIVTSVLAILFMLTSFFLSVFSSISWKTVIDEIKSESVVLRPIDNSSKFDERSLSN